MSIEIGKGITKWDHPYAVIVFYLSMLPILTDRRLLNIRFIDNSIISLSNISPSLGSWVRM
jgi:hypothetical protein